MCANRLVIAAALAVMPALYASAQTHSARWGAGAVPSITISTRAGYATGRSVGGDLALDAAQWTTALVAASPGLCESEGAFTVPGSVPGFRAPESASTKAVEWRISARLVSVEGDAITFDLKWSRTVLDAAVTPSSLDEQTVRLTMRDGAEGLLDMVRSGDSPGQNCGVFAVSLGADLGRQEESVVDAALQYELWLVHTDRDGHQSVERFVGRARQGAPLGYFFHSLTFDRSGSHAENGAVRLNVSGTIRGRARTDGLIDLTVDEWRSVGAQGGGVGGAGRKLLTVRSGETIEAEMATALQGTLSNGADVLKVSEAFAGHRTAIRITTRRLW